MMAGRLPAFVTTLIASKQVGYMHIASFFRQLITAICFIALMSLAATAQDNSPPAQLPSQVTNPSIDPGELELRLMPLTKTELEAAADAWLGIAKVKAHEVVDAMIRLKVVEGEAADVLRKQVTSLTSERDAALEKLRRVANAWEAKGGAAEAVSDIRAYRSSLLVGEVRQFDWQTLTQRGLDWITASDGGLSWIANVAIFLSALIALFFIAGIVKRAVNSAISRVPHLSQLLQSFLIVVVYWATIAVGLMVVLTALGFDITPLFAVIGGASFIVAFAMQDTLGNLASGLMIMINRPFDEGDFVDIAGTSGTVKSVNIVATKVTTPDNQVIVIPNNKVWGNIIRNVTTSPTRRVDMVFGIGYGDSIPKAQAALAEVVSAHPLVLNDPEPVIRVHDLADSSVNFVVRPWVNNADYWNVYWDLTQQVKERFDADGISIPFPQRDLHLIKDGS